MTWLTRLSNCEVKRGRGGEEERLDHYITIQVTLASIFSSYNIIRAGGYI